MPCHLRVILAAALLLPAAGMSAGEAPKPAAEPYELHEWGVFPVPRNDAWAMRDLKEEWAGFPAFFNRVWPERKLPYRGAVEKPVIFFHAEHQMAARLKIRFAEGRPLVWWPNADMPGWLGGDSVHGELDRLEFGLQLNAWPGRGPNEPPHEPPAVDTGHWIETLREVKASLVLTPGSYSNKQNGGGLACDSFLYYDGIMKAPATPKVTRDGGAVLIDSALDYPMLDMLVIDRKDGHASVSAFVDRVEPGARKTRLELTAADAKALEERATDLAKRTEGAGLNAAEAGSLVKVWHAGLFEADGLTLFYRIPQETYEKWLPLEAKPAPAKIVRVGLVVHSHLEPELDARVEALLKQLGADTFETRAAAQRALAKIGGAAFPALEKAAQGEDLEIAKTCRDLLKALDDLKAKAQK
ncbi:MAG: hypothetical protein HY291_07510 [Planctomycetes bacterium]|nr:hypothetical protein [Planctomycetota bacterium]